MEKLNNKSSNGGFLIIIINHLIKVFNDDEIYHQIATATNNYTLTLEGPLTRCPCQSMRPFLRALARIDEYTFGGRNGALALTSKW